MSKKVATREAYGKALARMGAVNSNIVVLDADLSKSTKTADFAAVFPDRFFDMGVAEQNMLGTAAGLAAAGKIPFASSFAVFATGRAFEQIRNSIAYPKLNVKIAATHAGISVGEDGASHQSIEDISLMRTLPNLTVIVPADAVETEKAVEAAVEINGPVYLRLGRLGLPAVFDENYQFEVGKAVTVKEGSDITIIACGLMVGHAVEAAEMLAAENISTRIINMHTIKPIDRDTVIKAARETGAIVTAEEHSIIGGLGSAVAEVLVQSEPVPQEMIGVRDTFGESGKPAELLQKYGLMPADIVTAVKKALDRKNG
ncbi:transketolase family protein [Phosphitispora sp. TUW77]|uniref:transketolase family protein n=1 Tax=Phosphitispora sp. TUW77 TaxID=3152361 RepID=UPI003AB705AC